MHTANFIFRAPFCTCQHLIQVHSKSNLNVIHFQYLKLTEKFPIQIHNFQAFRKIAKIVLNAKRHTNKKKEKKNEIHANKNRMQIKNNQRIPESMQQILC